MEKQSSFWDGIRTAVAVVVLLIIGIHYQYIPLPNYLAQDQRLGTQDQMLGIFNNANRLLDDYEWKLDLVDEIQNRTDALGNSAGKEYYIEWVRRNNEAIDAGERLATYLTENREVLDSGTTPKWASDALTWIAKNKVTFERDNQALEETIVSFEQPKILYTWRIDPYGREGSTDLETLIFENSGRNLSNIKFKFEFYTSSGKFYSDVSVDVGNVASGKIVRKKVSLPSRYWGTETWSKEKLFLYINGSLEEAQIFENGEWKEIPITKTD